MKYYYFNLPMDMIGPEECTKVIVINNKFIINL